MHPFLQAMPDPRLMNRLVGRVTRSREAGPFIAAGDALAVAILATRGERGLPEWAERLADAMVGSLLLVQDATMDDAEPHVRVSLSQAAAVLSIVRPRTAAATDAAISIWMAWGIGAPRCLSSPRALASRTLLALYLDNTADAADSVTALLDVDGDDGVGLILHDWTVVRIQHQGPERELGCWKNLRTRMESEVADATEPGLLVLGALLLCTREHPRRDHVLGWLDDMARGPSRRRATRAARATSA